MDDLVDGTPVGKTAESTVVDEEVGVELAGTDAGFIDFFAGVVGVDGKEFEAALGTEFDSFIQQTAFAGCPQDECVSFRLYFLEGCYGEGDISNLPKPGPNAYLKHWIKRENTMERI